MIGHMVGSFLGWLIMCFFKKNDIIFDKCTTSDVSTATVENILKATNNKLCNCYFALFVLTFFVMCLAWIVNLMFPNVDEIYEKNRDKSVPKPSSIRAIMVNALVFLIRSMFL